MDDTRSESTRNAILYPMRTWDYVIKEGATGLGTYAARSIKKGELIFDASIEFSFSDVEDGDYLLLYDKTNIGETAKQFPLSPDVLLRTHGVPNLTPDPTGKTAGNISWHLEMFSMMMNHSCNPNVIDDSHDAATGEGIAARNIRKGEELTYEYCTQYYNHGPFFEKCKCGAENCRGRMMGFKELTEEQKKKYFSRSSLAVQTMYLAEIGRGLPVKQLQVVHPPRKPSCVPRIVFPGPSHSFSSDMPVAIRFNDQCQLGLYAITDFKAGEKVYEFWRQNWPLYEDRKPKPFDMVFAMKHGEGDLLEGTVARLDPLECGAFKDRSGRPMFSGFDMFTEHCCEPNLAYNDFEESEDDEWRTAYATREINALEKLTVDYNSFIWDRSEEKKDGWTCHCGANKCTGSTKGLKYLKNEEREERKFMSGKHTLSPSSVINVLGEALSPFIREIWRLDDDLKDSAPVESESESSSSSSSDDESSSSSTCDS